MSPATSSSCSSSCSSIGSGGPIVQSEKKRANKSTKRVSMKAQKCKQTQTPTTTTTGGSRRSSIYRGVTRHRWTGRYEAHLWDKSSWNNIQNKKGRQVYLGAYDTEDAAARTYDLAALKYWGKDATLNFPIETYAKDVEEMDKASKEEYLASLRRQSSGFSRGISKYRGVARHHHNGRWEARIGRVCGNKYLYLGTYKTQEEAAVAYDKAAIEHRGLNAVTNFDISNYIDKIEKKNEEEPEAAQPDPTPPNTSDSEEAEVVEQKFTNTPLPENLHMQVHPQQLQNHVQYTHVPPSEEFSLVTVMDHVLEQDLPWSFMQSGLLSQYQDPYLDFSKVEDLMGMFDDDIDFLFSTEPGEIESDINISAVLDSFNDCGGDGANLNGVGAGSMVVDDKDQNQQLLSLNASPSSIVSFDYTL